VTPEYVLRQALLLEHTQAGVHQLVMQWLSGHGAAPRVRMHLGTIEAVKSAVASNLGMSIVPQMATSGYENDIVVRPLHPPLIRTLALIEHRSKPNEPAIEIVRNALLGLRDTDVVVPLRPASKRSTRSAAKPRPRRRQ
jgi:DNA-binding transcriptional LysR family regulator